MNYKLLNARRKSQAEAAAQNWLAVLISAPQGPQPPNPPSHGVQKGGRGANYQSISDVVVQDFGFIFVVFTQKCIVDDICDGGREGGRGGARFFHFPPAGSTNKRVGKVCLTFLPNYTVKNQKKGEKSRKS